MEGLRRLVGERRVRLLSAAPRRQAARQDEPEVAPRHLRALEEHRSAQQGLPLWAVARVGAAGMEFWRLPAEGEDRDGIYWTTDAAAAWVALEQAYAQMVHTRLLEREHVARIFLEIVGHAS